MHFAGDPMLRMFKLMNLRDDIMSNMVELMLAVVDDILDAAASPLYCPL